MTSREAKHQARLSVWQGSVAECRSSGLSARQWCRENQVSPQTYYRWESEVLEHASKEQPVFAEAPSLKTTADFRAVATLRNETLSVDVYPGADAATLKAICRALKSC